jgi:hypothetical protein
MSDVSPERFKRAMGKANRRHVPLFSTHFTCFTSTKVQILTPKLETPADTCRSLLLLSTRGYYAQFTCFTSRKVQILTQNTDAGTCRSLLPRSTRGCRVCRST